MRIFNSPSPSGRATTSGGTTCSTSYVRALRPPSAPHSASDRLKTTASPTRSVIWPYIYEPGLTCGHIRPVAIYSPRGHIYTNNVRPVAIYGHSCARALRPPSTSRSASDLPRTTDSPTRWPYIDEPGPIYIRTKFALWPYIYEPDSPCGDMYTSGRFARPAHRAPPPIG